MIKSAEIMSDVHSDIRGPIYYEALKMEKEGTSVLKLNTGNPAAFGFKMPDSVFNAIYGNERRALGYCNFLGMEDARCAIADYHRSTGITDITEDDIIIGNGVSEVAGFALQALLNPGDEVLLPCPCYSLWSNHVKLCAAKPVFYTCDEEAGWNPDCKDIISKITAKTRAIVIINPNNPTGAVYSKEVLEKIADIAREHNLLIFSDEIYDRLLLDGARHIPIATLAPDIPVITMSGLSKSHCLCGFRLGWMLISGPKNLSSDYRQSLMKLTSLRLCANAPAQLVVPAALADTEYTKSLVRDGGKLYTRREAVISELAKIPDVSFVKNQAAFYIFPKINAKKHNIKDDRRFAFDLLKATNILIVPGSGFDCQTPDHFRIVMLPEPNELAQAVRRIGEFLDTYKQK
jgi:alanine-synthesizing transaminase